MENYLDDFTQAYITAALWSSTDDEGQPLDAQYTRDDLALETFEQMKADCTRFQALNGLLIKTAKLVSKDGYDDEQAGHDFWLTRNGHGAGFWDRGLDVAGDALTEVCKKWPPVDLYIGDDGKIYAS